MGADTPISASLCEAHRKTFGVQLESIASDAAEAREGVGKLLRIITEGNGREALMTQVDRNSEFRERAERKGVTRVHRFDRWWIAIGGWGVTIIVAIWAILRGIPIPPA